jgi:DNA-binding SARP family transcriptional activator/Tfp pilus assembly protein PilF
MGNGLCTLSNGGVAVEFGVLGPVEVWVDGRPADAGHARQRAVLAVLLLEAGRMVPLEVLVDRVWGEDPPRSVRNVVYGYVGRLKAMVTGGSDPGVMLSRQVGGYLLQASAEQVDVHRFRGLVAEAAAAAGDDELAGVVLDKALALWRGRALARLDSPWLNGQRARLELERAAAAADLRDIRLRRGEHAAMAGELAAQAAESPADERLVGQLMLALYRCGRQAEALRWFEQTRRHLAGELGADPGPELQALHVQMLRADRSLAVAPAPLGRAAAPVPRELPTDVPAFTGRATELARLDRILTGAAAVAKAETPAAAGPVVAAGEMAGSGARDGPVATAVISAVSGTAGVGKTALAVHWAHRAANRFSDGQLYVNLRGYDPDRPLTAGDALAGFLRALGVPGQDIPPGQDERAARYRSLLAGRRMLIVLDNASQAEQVRSLLPGTPACAVVVTSRDSLVGLVARDGATRLDLDLLSLDEAVDLLRELIGERAGADAEATAALAECCGRLPLALRVAAELAAARPAEQLTDLVAELAGQQRLDLLDAAGDPRTAVRSVFSWSYRHLDADAARTFRLLGLHPGPSFDPCAAAALAGGTADQASQVLAELARAHLIESALPDRYCMHDLLRAYASELAATHDHDRNAALIRLFDHYLHTTASAMDTLYPAERRRRPAVAPTATPGPALTEPAWARAWLNDQRPVLISVAAHAAEQDWPGHATRLGLTLARHLEVGGYLPEAIILHGYVCGAARKTGDRAAEAVALVSLGIIDGMQSRYDHAAAHFEQSLTLSREIGDLIVQARALCCLGNIHASQGRYDQAVGEYQQALALFRKVTDRLGQARVLDNLGMIDRLQGRYPQSLSHHRQALTLLRKIGDRQGEARAAFHLGATYRRQGRFDLAATHLRASLAHSREVGDPDGEALSLSELGVVEAAKGREKQAVEHHNQALDLWRKTGNRSGETIGLNGLGEVLLGAGQPEDARVRLNTALVTALQIGDKYETARAHSGLGQACQATGERDHACLHWQQALTIYEALGAPEADEVRGRLATERATAATEHQP